MIPTNFLGPFRRVPVEVERGADKEIDFNLRGAGSSKLLEANWEGSSHTLWCWAAVAAMVARIYKRDSVVEQCGIASQCLQRRCCDEADECNVEGALEDALNAVGHMEGHPFNGVLNMSEIKAEIEALRPIGVRISWRGGKGHFVAIAGYDLETKEVVVLDPAGGVRPMPLHELKYRFDGTGRWTQIYYTRP